MESSLVDVSNSRGRIGTVLEHDLLSTDTETVLSFPAADSLTDSIGLCDVRNGTSNTLSVPFLSGSEAGNGQLPASPNRSNTADSNDGNVTVLEIVRARGSGVVTRRAGRGRQVSCPRCSRRLANRSLLKRHMLIHEGSRPFQCSMCDSTFNQSNALQAHQKSVHSTLRPFRCQLCPAVFALRGNLRAHERRRHSGRKGTLQQGLVCGRCGSLFPRFPALLLHSCGNGGALQNSPWTEPTLTRLVSRLMAEQHRDEARLLAELRSSRCAPSHLLTRCLQLLGRSSELAESGETRSSTTNTREWNSRQEEKICWSDDFQIRQHDSSTSNDATNPVASRLVCVCDAVASRMHLARAVYRSSSGSDVRAVRYHCLFCQHSLTKVADLIRHLRRHYDDRPFSCRFCDHRFRLRHVLQAHLQRMHGVREEKDDNRSHAVKEKEDANHGIGEKEDDLNHGLGGEKNHVYRMLGVRAVFTENRGSDTAGFVHCSVCDKKFRERPALLDHLRRVHGVIEKRTNRVKDLVCSDLVAGGRVNSTEIDQRRVPEEKSPGAGLTSCAEEESVRERVAVSAWGSDSEVSAVVQLPESVSPTVQLGGDGHVDVSAECFQVNADILVDELSDGSVLLSDCRLPVADPPPSQTCSCCHCGKVFVSASALSKHAAVCPPVRRRTRSALLSRKQTAVLTELPPRSSVGTGKSYLVCSAVEALTGCTSSSTAQRCSGVSASDARHVCTVCDKRFRKLCDLKRHSLQHSGERPFSCSLCQRRFSHKSNLTVHMRVHTGERNFSCLICGSAFTSKNSLLVHTRVHTGAKPFACDVCGRAFRTPAQRNVHVKTHDKERTRTRSRRPTVTVELLRNDLSSKQPLSTQHDHAGIDDSDSLNNALSFTDFSSSIDGTVNAGLFPVFVDLDCDSLPVQSSSMSMEESLAVQIPVPISVDTAETGVSQPPVPVPISLDTVETGVSQLPVPVSISVNTVETGVSQPPVPVPISVDTVETGVSQPPVPVSVSSSAGVDSGGCPVIVVCPAVQSESLSVTVSVERSSDIAASSSGRSWQGGVGVGFQHTGEAAEGTELNQRAGQCDDTSNNHLVITSASSLDTRRHMNSFNQKYQLVAPTNRVEALSDSSMSFHNSDVVKQFQSSMQSNLNTLDKPPSTDSSCSEATFPSRSAQSQVIVSQLETDLPGPSLLTQTVDLDSQLEHCQSESDKIVRQTQSGRNFTSSTTEADIVSPPAHLSPEADSVSLPSQLSPVADPLSPPAQLAGSQSELTFRGGSEQQQRCLQQALRLTRRGSTSCPLCDLQFDTRRQYLAHASSVHRRDSGIRCPLCPRAFHLRSQLRRHLRVHTGHRPFRCGLCTRTFSQNSSLQQHVRWHRGERPHHCPFCQHAFSQRGNLVTHVKRVHLPTAVAAGHIS